MQVHEKLEKENLKLKARVQELELLNKWYTEQLKLLRQKQFGTSSEKNKRDEQEQINLFNEAEADRQAIVVEPDMENISYSRKKGRRGENIKNLPVEVIEYTLPEGERACPACAQELHTMSKEIRKELTIVPAKVKVIEHVSYVYSCRNCEKNNTETPVITAKTPKSLLPKSMVSAELLAYIMSQKFVNAMPLYSQEQDFKRLGVKISRQNLSNWVIKGSTLLEPILNALKKDLITRPLLHADETTLEVLCEPGRPAQTNSYMWLYRTSGDTACPIVLYDYQEGRSGQFAKDYLSGFSGYLHTDGWKGYQKLEEVYVTLCGCWSHARRKFYEASVAATTKKMDSKEAIGLAYCDQLFSLEKKAVEQNMTPKERHEFRQKRLSRFWKSFING